MNKARVAILSVFILMIHVVVSAVNPSDTTIVVDTQVSDAGNIITNPYFKIPPVGKDKRLPGDSATVTKGRMSVDFISR